MERARIRRSSHRQRTTLFAVVAVFVGGGIAAGLALASIPFASIPDSDGVIHACYKRKNGDLRVIDPPVSTCRKHEKPLSWSATGSGVLSRVTYVLASSEHDSSDQKLTHAACPAGTVPLGGGYELAAGTTNDVRVVLSEPSGSFPSGGVASPEGWFAGAVEWGAGTNDEWNLSAIAICAPAEEALTAPWQSPSG